MSISLIDYGCHSFTFRLAARLHESGLPIRYLANRSLESPNQESVADWQRQYPQLVHLVSCRRQYGKMSLHKRLLGEIEWARECIGALEAEPPDSVVLSCVPLASATPIQMWARRRGIPVVYWLQDLQGRAMHNLLGHKFGLAGRVAGALADMWEQEMLDRSRMVITIAKGHDAALPAAVRREGRHTLLENWANLDEFPPTGTDNSWSRRFGLASTRNILYSGTLGFKHDLGMFPRIATALHRRPDVRVVVVSSGQGADYVRQQAGRLGLDNLLVLPFQPYAEVPKVLASATILIASLDPSAGGFCVPSKVLSYLCAGRPIVAAFDERNPAAHMIRTAGAGAVLRPGDTGAVVSAITQLLDHPGELASQGTAARAYAEKTFDIDRIASRFLSILARVGAEGSPRPYAWAPVGPPATSL